MTVSMGISKARAILDAVSRVSLRLPLTMRETCSTSMPVRAESSHNVMPGARFVSLRGVLLLRCLMYPLKHRDRLSGNPHNSVLFDTLVKRMVRWVCTRGCDTKERKNL